MQDGRAIIRWCECHQYLLPEGAELHCCMYAAELGVWAGRGQSRASGLIVYSWHLMLGSSPASMALCQHIKSHGLTNSFRMQ